MTQGHLRPMLPEANKLPTDRGLEIGLSSGRGHSQEILEEGVDGREERAVRKHLQSRGVCWWMVSRETKVRMSKEADAGGTGDWAGLNSRRQIRRDLENVKNMCEEESPA